MNDEEKKQKIYKEVLAEAQSRDTRKRENEFSADDFARDAGGISRELAVKICEEHVIKEEFGKRIVSKYTYYFIV